MNTPAVAAIVAFRNPIQALLFSDVLVPELTKGHWAGAYPHGHAEPWAGATPQVGDKVGVGFEPIKDNYDLLNKDFVDSVTDKAIKKVKSKTGVELTARELRKELNDMMFIMRTPIGKPLAQSHQGMMTRPGRPSKTDLTGLVANARAAKKAKTPRRTAEKATKAPAKRAKKASATPATA